MLKEKSREVKEMGDAVKNLIGNMADTLYDAPGVGLAANQIGVPDRIFLFDVGEGLNVCINPRITFPDEEMTEAAENLEGCLSLPGIELPVERHVRLKLEYQDEKGEARSLEAEGLLARVIQHETDHLDGVVILDRADRKARAEALKRLRDSLYSL